MLYPDLKINFRLLLIGVFVVSFFFSFLLVNDCCVFPQVQKLAVVVELLLGDIPERSIFRQPIMRKPLAPYFQLTQGKSSDCLKSDDFERVLKDCKSCYYSCGAFGALPLQTLARSFI